VVSSPEFELALLITILLSGDSYPGL